MTRRLKTLPLGELTEVLCLVARNHASIFEAVLDTLPAEPTVAAQPDELPQ
jgi:hypothetical protein